MKILNALLEISLYSVILAAAILLLKQCFKNRLSPFLHFAIWGLLIARLLIPITLESSVHLITLPAEMQSGVVIAQIQPQATQPINASTVVSNPQVIQPQTSTVQQVQTSTVPATVPAARQSTVLSTQQILLILWLTGVGIGLLYLFVLHVALRRRILRNTAPSSPRLRALFQEVKAELGVRAKVKLLCQYEYGTPALLFPKTVLLPLDALVAMDDEQVKFALRHELTHFRRGDQITSLLLAVLNAIYWFNPIVWLTFKQIRADMETACDSAVVRRLDHAQRSRYAALIVSLFARPQHRQLALGMAQGDTKKLAERRVRGIYMQNRSKRSAKLVSTLLAVVLLVGCFTTACQPTPTKAVVVGKNDGKLEAAIKATTPPAATATKAAGTNSAAVPIASPFPAPTRLEYNLPGAKKDFVVQVDAPVEVPQSGVFPVIKAKNDVFTQEMVDRVRELLLPGETLYQPTDVMTKKQYQTEIDFYNKQLADSIEGGYAQLVKDYKKILKDLMAKQAAAPETVELKPADMTLHFREEDSYIRTHYGKEVEVEGGMRIDWTPETLQKAKDDGYLGILGITSDLKAGGQKQFSVKTWREGASPRIPLQGIGYAHYTSDNYIIPAPSYTIDGLTMEAATAQAQKLFQLLGLSFSLVAATIEGYDADPESGLTASHAYSLVYKRDVGTITQNNYGRVRATDSLPGIEQFTEETINVTIDNDGIQGFSWQYPVRVLGVENPNVKLLGFDQIKAIFDKQIVTQYEARPKQDESIQSQRLVIYKVTLSAMPIRIQNEPNTFRYVPVWDFCGKLIGKYADDYAKGTSDRYMLDEYNERVVMGMGAARDDVQDVSFLTINAIDGSIIDRSLGY